MDPITLCPESGLQAQANCEGDTKIVDIYVDASAGVPVNVRLVVHKPEGEKSEIELPVGHRLI